MSVGRGEKIREREAKGISNLEAAERVHEAEER